ncbi:hypothetical protein Poli38472_009267 [Pythium oligandrum]|uniref:Uncharacterized protein n=1 Tax=Pythium oligandrum TaxID=41045 RepID=A0A8K1FIK7_PYTOL|nr:hypothetical protein Poli38472_009267 [Pythium oligandrum]|eukprot:TMW65100.1 hypothetical protein Poli38472_009267 [Pythium oligandrum]
MPLGRRFRFPIVAFLLTILNTGSTFLTLFSGLSENPILVTLTGRYDPIRARLQDGSINMEIARKEAARVDNLTPLSDIGANFRFITAPRRNPYSYGENRTLCMVVDSINSSIVGAYYDDFWGKGPRHFHIIVFSISAPNCKALNLKPKYRSQCIKDQGNVTACNQYILDNFEKLQGSRPVISGTVSDFGTPGVPFLKCLARPFKSFEYQTDMVTHQAYWAGAQHHMQIQTSDCLASPLIRTTDWQWTLFDVQAKDQDSDIVLALPEPGWFAWVVSGLYSIVTLLLIARGIITFFFQNRAARYIPDEVRFSKDHRFFRYIMPFMPFARLLTDDERSIIPFKGSLIIASDVWMNHWLYITLSILDSVANIRLAYCSIHLGTSYVMIRVTIQNFLFVCTALTRMTWIMCLIHTVLRILAKVFIRSLKSMQVIRATTRDKIERYIDGTAMFLSFKVYNILLCIILYVMMRVTGKASFMKRQTPYKAGNYGGIPKIGRLWESELMCDFVTILLLLGACGQVLGTILMLTRFRKVADNGVMRTLQKRYFWVGWDGMMAAQMLGLDPMSPNLLVDGHAHTQCSLGTVIQLLFQSGPSGVVHLAGDYIFAGAGFTMELRKFVYPLKHAVLIGLCKHSRARKDGVTNESENVATALQRPSSTRPIATATLDSTAEEDRTKSHLVKDKTSIFDRELKLVADGYFGKILLVDTKHPGSFNLNKETGLREYVVTDALASISITDIKWLLGNEKKLRIE